MLPTVTYVQSVFLKDENVNHRYIRCMHLDCHVLRVNS